MLMAFSLLSGCVPIGAHQAGDKAEESVKTEFAAYLEKTYNLRIAEGSVFQERRRELLHGVDEGDWVGVFYDERDPGLGIQIKKTKNGIQDFYSPDLFEFRQDCYRLLEQYKPGNPLNRFVSVIPEYTEGPSDVFPAYLGLRLGILRRSFDREAEMKSDYALAQAIYERTSQYIKEHAISTDTIRPFHADFAYYADRDSFDLDNLLGYVKKKGYFGTDSGSLGNELYRASAWGYKASKLPGKVYKYEVSDPVDPETGQFVSFEDYQRLAKESKDVYWTD